MKVLRIWLLVLLAGLLPVRGAAAAAMLCPPAGVGTQSEVPLMDHQAVGHDHQDGTAASVQHVHDDGAQHDHGLSGQDQCNLCSAFCSLTPLVSEHAGVAEPRDLATNRFPGFSAPAPSFLSDGQERPPRSI